MTTGQTPKIQTEENAELSSIDEVAPLYSPTGRFVVHAAPDMSELIPFLLDAMQKDLVSMRKALADKDFATLHRSGHSHKGFGASYGFDYISFLGSHIQVAADRQNVEELGKLPGLPIPVSPGVLVLAHPLLAVRGGVRLQCALRQGVGPRAHLPRDEVELVERRRGRQRPPGELVRHRGQAVTALTRPVLVPGDVDAAVRRRLRAQVLERGEILLDGPLLVAPGALPALGQGQKL